MSKQATAKKTRGAPKKKVHKVRLNISLSDDANKMAKKMAFDDGASLSGWLERLIRNAKAQKGAQA